MRSAAEASDITLIDQTLKIVSIIKAFRSRGDFVGYMLFLFQISVYKLLNSELLSFAGSETSQNFTNSSNPLIPSPLLFLACTPN